MRLESIRSLHEIQATLPRQNSQPRRCSPAAGRQSPLHRCRCRAEAPSRAEVKLGCPRRSGQSQPQRDPTRGAAPRRPARHGAHTGTWQPAAQPQVRQEVTWGGPIRRALRQPGELDLLQMDTHTHGFHGRERTQRAQSHLTLRHERGEGHGEESKSSLRPVLFFRGHSLTPPHAHSGGRSFCPTAASTESLFGMTDRPCLHVGKVYGLSAGAEGCRGASPHHPPSPSKAAVARGRKRTPPPPPHGRFSMRQRPHNCGASIASLGTSAVMAVALLLQ